MNQRHDGDGDSGESAWLDRALERALPPPQLPTGFRAQLAAAVQRAGRQTLLSERQALAADYERPVADLHQGYVRLQWRTLGTLLGVAFVCGVGLTLAMPWLRMQLGDWGPIAVAGGGAVVGIAIGARSWLRPGSRWHGA